MLSAYIKSPVSLLTHLVEEENIPTHDEHGEHNASEVTATITGSTYLMSPLAEASLAQRQAPFGVRILALTNAADVIFQDFATAASQQIKHKLDIIYS